MASRRDPGRVAFAVALIVAIVVLWWSRLRFWYPHDEGTLAQAALRVLGGEVPHRDFAHPYSGADALLHGVFFRLFGPSLAGIRTGFAVMATAWLAAMGWWFRRHLGFAGAAVAVTVLGAWSMAMYPAAVPSWYVTMLVTGAVAVLATPGASSPAPRRLLVAGLALGLALGFKVTALYAVVGVVAWLLARQDHDDQPGRPWAIALMLVAAVAALRLLLPTATPRTAVHLLLPPLTVALWVTAVEMRRWRHAGAAIDPGAVRALVALTAGVILGALPVFAWLGFEGALPAFLASVGEVGSLRAAFAGLPPPPLTALLFAVPLLGLVATASLPRPPRPGLLLLPCLLVFALAWSEFEWHRMVWLALRGSLPLGIILLLALAWRGTPATPRPWCAAIAVLGWMALSQFPFAAAVYFVYLAPLAVMIAVAAVRHSTAGRRVLATLGLAVAAFGYLQVVPSPPTVLGWNRMPLERLAVLGGPHGGLLVPANDSMVYGRLLAILADSVPPGAIWSGPDAPEVAFLAGRRDLNPAFFGFLGAASDGDAMADAVALVIRQAPPFSPPPTAAMLAAWQRRHPRRADLGPFTVLWGRPACDDC